VREKYQIFTNREEKSKVNEKKLSQVSKLGQIPNRKKDNEK